MRRDYRVEKEPVVMIIPMIDIMLFLLVFFMISTIYMVQANTLPVNLPAAAAAHRETRPRIVAITVQTDGTIQYERDAMRPAELSSRIRQALQSDKETVFVLRGDKTATYENIVAVLDALKQCGARHVSIATERKGGE
ncbi:MAG: ExbD/TolR family protein [Schwartzia sp. (in: firmicutes)]